MFFCIKLQGGAHNPLEFIYKNCVFILTCLNFSHLQSSPFDATSLCNIETFFSCSKQFLNLSLRCLLVLLVFFVCFTSSTSAKCFNLRTFFIKGNKKTSHLGQDQVNRKGGVWGSCHFCSKTAEHSVWCGQVCS